MMQSRVSLQASTISALLPASASTVDLRAGKEIHGYSLAMGLKRMYMSERSSVTWNSVIFAYANHGYCDEAIEPFNQMVKMEERKFDHLTFTAVLIACSHAGMVDLGEGKIDEAYGIVQRMPIEADLFMWGALLGACRQHNCLDLAKIAAKRLAKLELKSSGSSVVLSSLYGEYSRWENVLKVKKTTKKKKLRSFTGCSWIQVV
ncbi:hypothetical protein ACS0TY_017994 [Phlomoides rotata]